MPGRRSRQCQSGAGITTTRSTKDPGQSLTRLCQAKQRSPAATTDWRSIGTNIGISGSPATMASATTAKRSLTSWNKKTETTSCCHPYSRVPRYQHRQNPHRRSGIRSGYRSSIWVGSPSASEEILRLVFRSPTDGRLRLRSPAWLSDSPGATRKRSLLI